MFLACPVCYLPLKKQLSTLSCEANHSFDVAKQGYVNLLLAQHKHSKTPGDTKVSLQARRAFLTAGHYQPLQAYLQQLLQTYRPKHYVDIGCGEGYYTQALSQSALHTVALDIAKDAIMMAAKQSSVSSLSAIDWIVSSAYRMPILDHSIDVVTAIFAPLASEDIKRILSHAGYLVVARANQQHLYQFRQALFAEVNPTKEQTFVELASLFEPVHQHTLTVPLALSFEALQQLIVMTPYAYKAPPSRIEQLLADTTNTLFHTDAVFDVSVWRVKN